jgi:hypothetical protein
MDESALDDGDWGLLGEGQPPGPVGAQAIPLDSGSDTKPAASGVELNLVGNYEKPKSWTAQKELTLIRADTWFPHSADFLAVAGKGSIIVATPEDLLLKIIGASGSISRLNFFSHGVTGKIATSGEVDEDGKSCSLVGGWTQVTGSSKMIPDPYAKYWGDEGQNSSNTLTVGSRTFSLDQVRAKFAPGAEIWFYVCHGAVDGRLLANLANAFQVKVKSFSKIIVYCAPADFPKSRAHKVNVLTGNKPSDACAGAVSDFRSLTPDRSAAPVKP